MTPNGLHLDGYIRVSKVGKRQGKSFISPDEQRREIEAWAKAHNVTVTMQEPELDRSGGTMDRPIFNRVMERIRSGQTQGIIVVKLDRFARSVVGALTTLQEMEKYGSVLVCTRDDIDLSTPMGRAFMKMMLIFAELERDRLTENFKDATEAAVKRGAFIGPAPLGYRRIDEPTHERVGCLEPDEDAPTVTEAFERAAKDGIQAAAKWLGLSTSDARRMLSSRVYLGELHHPAGVNLHAHKPLTDLGTFTAAQTEPRMRARNGDYPLSGIARCGGCGGALVGQNAVDRHGDRKRRYRCQKHTSDACSSCSAEALEDLIRSQIADALGSAAIRVGSGSESLLEAESILREAESDLVEHASNITRRKQMGPAAYDAATEALSQAAEEARRSYQEAAAKAASVKTLPAADELGDPGQLGLAARAMLDKVILLSGRQPVRSRTELVWQD